LIEKGGKVRFYCHNCSASMQFRYFMKEIDRLFTLNTSRNR
jgi:hypothetical protein